MKNKKPNIMHRRRTLSSTYVTNSIRVTTRFQRKMDEGALAGQNHKEGGITRVRRHRNVSLLRIRQRGGHSRSYSRTPFSLLIGSVELE